MVVKVILKARVHEVIEVDAKNSIQLQNILNEKYGLKGWVGFEIISR